MNAAQRILFANDNPYLLPSHLPVLFKLVTDLIIVKFSDEVKFDCQSFISTYVATNMIDISIEKLQPSAT